MRVPVIAAGAIADGRGLLAALALGASGVQPGTAFLRTPEAGAAQPWQAALAAAADESTCLTDAFSGKPARGLRNRFIEEMAGRPIAPFPAQNALTRALRSAAAQQGRSELLALWAGQAASLAKPLPAAEIIRSMVAETEAVLKRLG